VGYGISLALLIRSGLGMNPWGVLQVALADRSGLSVGAVVIAVSFIVMVAWWPLRQRPGIGTVANCFCVGAACDAALAVIPSVDDLLAGALLLLGGVLLHGVSSAVYIGAGLGPGPRDGLMTGLHRITGRSMRLVRLCIELTVLVGGILLGGPVGVGTAVFALAVGPIVQWALPKVRVDHERTESGASHVMRSSAVPNRRGPTSPRCQPTPDAS
jgi:uncharacterized membrane protein YczE